MAEYYGIVEDLERELAEVQDSYRYLKSMHSRGLISDEAFRELTGELLARLNSIERRLLAARRPRRKVRVKYAPVVAAAVLLMYLSLNPVTLTAMKLPVQLERIPIMLDEGSEWAGTIAAKPGVEVKLEIASTLPLEVVVTRRNSTLVAEKSTRKIMCTFRVERQDPIKLEIKNKSGREANVTLVVAAVQSIKVDTSHVLFKVAALALLAIGVLLMWPRREPAPVPRLPRARPVWH
ncbi:MAG: hypothetical protein DRN99_05405 [Thermoproteota archaeon]|nr:MAG: hypothetical protein DRN99_05405 [Candidatus Korarchaeota archaeon]